MRTRLVIRVPVAVVMRLKATSSAELTMNMQLAKIVDTFDWSSLPYELNFDPEVYSFQQVTVMVLPAGRAALKQYCQWQGKRMNTTFAQALVALGLFEVPVKRSAS